MAAGAWTFTNGGRTSLLNGTFDIDSDSWRMRAVSQHVEHRRGIHDLCGRDQ